MAEYRNLDGPGAPRRPPREPYDPEPPTAFHGADDGDGAELRTLLSQLGRDASQLAHDEMTLARMELRSVSKALSEDVRDASRALVKDMAKVGIALTFAAMAGLALTAGLVIGVGMLVGAYWAGGLIVGAVLLAAALIFGLSAARDLRRSEALRLEQTREVASESADVITAEADATRRFARDEAREFKKRATPPEKPMHN
jgi:hypothetical protein